MIFELLAWVYISIICFAWGRQLISLFFSGTEAVAFPIVCFAGLSFIGIIAMYVSLFGPISFWIKCIVTIPALLFYIKCSNRLFFLENLQSVFRKMSSADATLLISCVGMLLFLTTSPIIHPDSLNYHVDSIRLYSLRGLVPGMTNWRVHFGFQSSWFAEMNFFSMWPLEPNFSFPLNGCVMCWLIVFLIAESVRKPAEMNSAKTTGSFWFLVLLLGTLISWTQIRLTASSASPDFIAAMAIFTSLYFLAKNTDRSPDAFYFATYFAFVAVSIKFSVIPILLVPVLIFIYGLILRRYQLVLFCFITGLFFLVPILIRNVVSSGYPFFPSSFAGTFFHNNWKLDELHVAELQHYITAYARYPVLREDTEAAYGLPIRTWLPNWWNHLYLMDRFFIVLIIGGVLMDTMLFRKWKNFFSINSAAALLIALTGVVFWFVNAPDPRFGTGFLFPLIYFQYAPFWQMKSDRAKEIYLRITPFIKWGAGFLILLYVLYRSFHFFQPGQLIYPAGIKKENLTSSDTFFRNPS